ncbi:MAG TPA: exosortase A [Janthinobacterium sp.]|nr:exosortase A [Janthinobacterium sp.]
MNTAPASTTPTARVTPIRPARGRAALPALLALGAILALYHDTFWSMILLWSRSQTFAHGYVIVPLSAWLVWRQRAQLAAVPLRPCGAGLVLLLALGLAWLLAAVADVPVVSQYAATAMLPAALLATLGWRLARAIAFPLAYLMLAVPFGEVFLPPLIDFTARFTVTALQLTGVPVFRENNNFSIPSGNWSVVEACSGLRYVIASLALGSLYAYLNYRSLTRRLVFIGISLLLPILANGVRAYLIVMIGHWSGMRLAVGVDHLVYGWLFFGLVSLLLFWGGAHWREERAPAAKGAAGYFPPRPGATMGAAACVAIAVCWPLLAAALLAAPATPAAAWPLAIATPIGWRAMPTPPPWRPAHAGAPRLFVQSYQRAGAATVSLQLAWYASQAKGSGPLALPPPGYEDEWALDGVAERTVMAGPKVLTVRQTLLRSTRGRVLVWRWYRQGGIDTGNAFAVKLLLAKGKLLGGDASGADIILAAPYDDREAPPEATLAAFLSAMWPAIDKGLRDAGRH